MSSTNNFECVYPYRNPGRTYDDTTMRVHKDAIKNILRQENRHRMPVDFERESDLYVEEIVSQYEFTIGAGSYLDPETKRCYVKNMAFYLGKLNSFGDSNENCWYAAEKIINYLL